MRNTLLYILVLIFAFSVTSCESKHRKEIEERKERLHKKIVDEAAYAEEQLKATQAELEKTEDEYNRQEANVNEHRRQLCATEQELTGLTLLRMKRDSLQARIEAYHAELRLIKEKHPNELNKNNEQ